MSTKEPGDRAVDRYLQGDSALSKVYRGAASEAPPSELDAAILHKARHAVEAQVLMRRRRALQRWLVPTSLAAALILTVGLVTFMYERNGAPLVPKYSSEKHQRPAELPRREPPLQQLQETTPEPNGGVRSDITIRPTTSGEAAQPPASAAPELMRFKEEAGRALPQLDKARESDQRMPAVGASEAELPPQEWLKRIAELRKQGKLSEAQASLAEFKRRYPDYPVETILK